MINCRGQPQPCAMPRGASLRLLGQPASLQQTSLLHLSPHRCDSCCISSVPVEASQITESDCPPTGLLEQREEVGVAESGEIASVTLCLNYPYRTQVFQCFLEEWTQLEAVLWAHLGSWSLCPTDPASSLLFVEIFQQAFAEPLISSSCMKWGIQN